MLRRALILFSCLISTLAAYTPPYYLSVCAVFRNEARFLPEWIEYHKLMGVDHFYLLNHLSTDHYLLALHPYIEEGTVDLIDWPYEPADHKDWTEIQCRAYNTILDNRGRDSYWMAVIDTDEFIVPVEDADIPSFLQNYEDCAGIGINWQHYGTSNVDRIPSGQLLIETLTQRAPKDHPLNCFVKTIFQPKRVKKMKKPHHCKYKEGHFHVTENKEPFTPNKSLTETVSVDKIRINHYIYRDEEFFLTEKSRRVAQWFPNDPPASQNPAYNEIEDLILLPIAKKLKKSL